MLYEIARIIERGNYIRNIEIWAAPPFSHSFEPKSRFESCRQFRRDHGKAQIEEAIGHET